MIIQCKHCGTMVHHTFIGQIIYKQDSDGIAGVSYVCLNCVKRIDPFFVPCNQSNGNGAGTLLCKLSEDHTGVHIFI